MQPVKETKFKSSSPSKIVRNIASMTIIFYGSGNRTLRTFCLASVSQLIFLKNKCCFTWIINFTFISSTSKGIMETCKQK
jgi:hypothetical protein